MGEAGAGRMGNYSFCSFSVKGTGRFVPEEGASPFVGSVGKMEVVEEERIETVCDNAVLDRVIRAIREAHPYEEVPLDILPLLDPP